MLRHTSNRKKVIDKGSKEVDVLQQQNQQRIVLETERFILYTLLVTFINANLFSAFNILISLLEETISIEREKNGR